MAIPVELELSRLIDREHEGTGAAIVVLDGNARTLVAHGSTALHAAAAAAAAAAASDHSIFQIASLTKIFTALLLADAVLRGELALDDRVDRHLLLTCPAFDGQSMTLADLATHTSGLPLRPPSRAPLSQHDPYADYPASDLAADLAAVQLCRRPGSAFEYSNFGYGLLGEALSRCVGIPYAELLQKRILEPLGMANTAVAPRPAMHCRLVQGYHPDFAPARAWSFGMLAPAGALYSSLDDLARFLDLFLGHTQHRRLAAAAHLMLTIDRCGDDAANRMALGWRKMKNSASTVLWSSGNAGGVRSFMACRPDRSRGVVGFINKASAEIGDLCLSTLD